MAYLFSPPSFSSLETTTTHQTSTSSSTSLILSMISIYDSHSQPKNNTISTMINCCCSMIRLCLSCPSVSMDCNEEESSKMASSSHLSQKESMPCDWNITISCLPPQIHSKSLSPPYFSTKGFIVCDLQSPYLSFSLMFCFLSEELAGSQPQLS